MHVIKRGTRGLPIVRNTVDRKRFKNLLFYLNDSYRNEYWERAVKDLTLFERPKAWPERKPLVKILGWSLMPNHFHLVLQEIQEGGIAKFMQKLCGSMSTHFNAKYNEKGSIFQSSYKGRTANLYGDEYLRLLTVYVLIKNPFELYPGGLKKAILNFDDAYLWTAEYPFCSLGDFIKNIDTPTADKFLLDMLFEGTAQFKKFAKECLLYKLDQLEMIEKMDKSDLSKSSSN
ncbi:MAG TPA: transposase [Candidatus Paceibacterota bacterium]|nr:transposase [Candidatus Paceibacterota bacterium]